MNIRKIESRARRIMRTGRLPKKLPNYYYNILEDANYHELNRRLVKKRAFSSKRPWITGQNRFLRYKRKGGETWRL